MENAFGSFVDYKLITRNDSVIFLFDVLKDYPTPFEWTCAKEDFKVTMEELKKMNKSYVYLFDIRLMGILSIQQVKEFVIILEQMSGFLETNLSYSCIVAEGAIIKTIYDTCHQFQWVFLGAFPPPIRPLVEQGLVEFHPWVNLYNYGEKIRKLNINMLVAPLQDNNFNKSKSDLKWIEANCFGLPIACQNLCTYKDAPFKFDTGDEMVDVIKDVLSKKGRYMNICAAARKEADKRWMEDNMDSYEELFKYGYASPERKKLNAINGIVI